ncbi:hypothetical protein LCGC14_1171290 [marine sediment metagenome]|uniref:Tip attachment protein J domain-containing protein n=1 Tax=marine sediment metagenome TaxID=412755 RepID=A0A0F9LUM0_9ZZZZ
MVLVEFTINGTLNRLSIGGAALTNMWEDEIVSFDPPQYSIAQRTGGYVDLTVGGMSLRPDLFDDDWPPPVSAAVSVYYTDSTDPDESAKETLFIGIAHRNTIERTSIKYDFYGSSYTVTVADATAYNDTLDAVMTTLCGAGILNLTIDTSASRAASPNVTHTTNGKVLAIDLASNICEFYSHLFYVVDGTLYLVDMLGDNGTQTITEYDYFASTKYIDEVPISAARAKVDDATNYSRYSSYPYSDELNVVPYHTTEGNINTALDDILTIYHMPRANLEMPLLGSLPVPGKKISWIDTSLGQSTNVWIRARTIQYDFENERVIIEGEGNLSELGALLMENGNYLLLENGGRILLEYSA